jgi:hypothetical protein
MSPSSILIVAEFDFRDLNLFQSQDIATRAGQIVIFLFLLGLFVWILAGLIDYLKSRRLEKSSTIYGDPKALLESACNLLGLGISERFILRKTASWMSLSQPVSILLCPKLLKKAADTWEKRHFFTPTKLWGQNRFNYLSKILFDKPISQIDE